MNSQKLLEVRNDRNLNAKERLSLCGAFKRMSQPNYTLLESRVLLAQIQKLS